MTFRTAVSIGCVLTTVLIAIAVAATTPAFSNDSQYYLQSGFLWADGRVSYAASLVGSRIYAVIYDNAFQTAFGPSIDAVSFALGVAYLLFCASVWLFMRGALPSSPTRDLLSLALCIAGYFWLEWTRPLAEPFLAVIVILALAAQQASGRSSSGWSFTIWACVAAGICGFGIGFRTEIALLFILILVAMAWKCSTIHGVYRGAATAVAMIGIYLVISTGPQLAFRAFTGQPMPPQLTGYLLFYKTVEDFGNPGNGPASAKLQQLGSRIVEDIPELQSINPMRVGLSGAFTNGGPAAANRLFIDAGIETLRSSPVEVAKGTLTAFVNYMLIYGGDAYVVRSDDLQAIADANDTLQRIDQVRVKQSVLRFGGDHFWPVATITEHRHALGRMLDNIPTVSVVFSLPAWIVVALALWAYTCECRRNGPINIVLVAAAFYVGSCLVAAFSQGFGQRYWLPSSFCLTLVSVSAIVATTSFVSLAQCYVNRTMNGRSAGQVHDT